MQVKRLEINGFKSFGDRCVVDFPQSMCAVVGPNGCGKSNVVDAVRWVLGEQSARLLRGKAMEDVIFNGAEGRSPQGMAEVSLVFENNGSLTHPQFSELTEIMISRRLYRSGDSEYLINKMPCRLKDIQHLLMDTGLGNRAYAIIEQGRVAAFIEAKPEERRLWVEEAAGITRYKNQKKVSLRKMQQTRENMDRLMDIMTEVETQMRRLERQAKKAESYQKLRKRIKDLDLNISSFEYQELCESLQDACAESDAVGAQLLLANQRVTGLETELETVKVQLISAEQDIAYAGEIRFQTRDGIQKAENEITLVTRESQSLSQLTQRQVSERDSISQRLEQTKQELARAEAKGRQAAEALDQQSDALEMANEAVSACQSRLRSLESRVDLCKQALVDHLSQTTQVKNRLSDLGRYFGELMRRKEGLMERRTEFEDELGELSERKDDASMRLDDLQYQLGDTEDELDEIGLKRQEVSERVRRHTTEEREATRRRHQLSASLDSLSASLASYDWAQDGVRQTLEAAEKGQLGIKIKGLVADHLRVSPGAEPLVEAALGPELQALVVADGQAAKALARWAQEKNLSALKVVALDSLPANTAQTPREGQALSELARPLPGYESLAGLLGGIGVSGDLDSAWDSAAQLEPGQSLVSRTGQRMSLPGVLHISRPQGETSVLTRKNKLAKMKMELEQADQALNQITLGREKAENLLAGLDERVSLLKSTRQEQERQVLQQEKELIRLEESHGAKLRALEGISLDAEEVDGELGRVREEQARLKTELDEFDQRHPSLEEDLAGTQEELTEARLTLENEREKEAEFRLAQAALASQAQHAAQEVTRLSQEAAEGGARVEILDSEILEARRKVSSLRQRHTDQEAKLGQLYLDLERQETTYNQAKERHTESQVRVNDLEASLKEARAIQRQVESQSQKLDLTKQQLELKLNHVCQQVMERCRVDLSSEHQSYLPTEKFDFESARGRLDKLRQQLVKMGPVNLEAITEHEALTERHEFLSGQKADLDASLADLSSAVRKINKTSRARFKETLAKVNQSMTEVFPVLFTGGSATLELDPNVDPLEAGLHLMVDLPGKKLRNLEALSGGEKALSAVAVLFALFLIRPAPLCILDEVDAPLDEANVGRFHDLLRRLAEHSQIVMITHSRRTMEVMDTLYGVTMEEKGVSKIMSVNLKQGEAMAA